MDEVLALDEQELDELSKEIVGNGVLEHARVIRQWRRCRMEESLRKELEVELTNEGQGVEVPLSLTEEDRQEVQPKVRVAPNDLREQQQYNAVDAAVTPEKEQDVIGESWQQYLRKQIRVEMEETEPLPVRNVIAASRTTASGFTEESDDDDYETYESITIDPSLASSSGEEDDDIRTTYNPLNPLGAVASDMMGYLEDGISSFFEPELPKKETKEPPPKSFLEAGLDFLYANETEVKHKRKKKKKKQPKTLMEDGTGYFYNDDGTTEKQGNKRNSAKKNKKKTRNRSFNRLKSKKERAHQTTQQEAYKLVPARSLQQRSRFVV